MGFDRRTLVMQQSRPHGEPELGRDLTRRELKERKKAHSPREGWEDGTPPPGILSVEVA